MRKGRGAGYTLIFTVTELDFDKLITNFTSKKNECYTSAFCLLYGLHLEKSNVPLFFNTEDGILIPIGFRYPT